MNHDAFAKTAIHRMEDEMSDWSYLLGNVHQAIEAILSDESQSERVKAACVHIHKTPPAFLETVLSPESKQLLANIRAADDTNPYEYGAKVQALGSFIVCAIQDTAQQYRNSQPGK